MSLNSILQQDAVSVQTRLTKYTVNASECWGSKWFNDDKFLTSEVSQTDDSLSFQDLVALKDPDHWYKLDEAVTGAVADAGSYVQNGTSQPGTGVAQPTLLDGGTGFSARFGNGSTAHYIEVPNFKIFATSYGGVDYTDGYINEFTLEFLLTLDGELTGTVCCPIMGQYDAVEQKMFGPVTLNRVGTKNYLAFGYNLADSLILVNDYAFYPWVYTTITVGETYHFMVTYKSGTVTLYKNGVAIMTRALGRSAFHTGGFPWVNDSKPFRIGYSAAFTSTTACPVYFHLDEVIFYRTALSSYEAYRHYFKSQNFYEAGGGGSGPPPIEGNCDNRVLPTLTGALDVTQYILDDSLQLGRGDQNLVDTLTFSCAEEWGQVFLQSVFRANDYLIVEKRYLSLDGTIDTGWISQGHFLVEGPVGQEIAEGRKVYTVTAKSVSKWLMLDAPYRVELVPDRTFISRRKMEDVSSGAEYKSFRIPKSGTPGLFYGNIATFPTPKIWLRDFPPILGDIVTANDVIRAKGSEESTQFVYGTGTYRIDTDYYTAAVKDKGLGAPATIEIEAYRHLGYDDIIRDVKVVGVTTEISGTDVIRAAIRIANSETRFVSGETYIGRTVFLQDGNAQGYMYRIVDYGPYADWFRWDGVVYTNFTVSGNFETPVPSYDAGAHLRVGLTGTPQASTLEIDFSASIASQNWAAYDTHEYKVYFGRARINTAGVEIRFTRTDTTTLTKTATVTEHLDNGKYWYTVSVDTSAEKATLASVDKVRFSWTFTAGDMATVDDYCVISPGNLYDGSDDIGLGLVNYVGGELPDLVDDRVATTDLITVGDANTPAQMLTKCFLAAGFQNQDSTKPFYFEFVDPTFDGGVALPPQVFTAEDGNPWGSIVKEILEQCPPNYVLYLDKDGVHRTKNVTQKSVANADHTILKTIDYNIDGTDYGVITRVIARGKSIDYIDIGLSDTVGGNAAYGAYKLNNFSDFHTFPGINKSKTDADVIINQIANGDPKTPAGWGSDGGAQTYGVIWRMHGTGTSFRWSMEDSNLFWIDLGRNATSGQLYTVEEIEVQVFSPMYPVGTIIEQTLQFYYMTEDDYTAATGHVPPATPNAKTRENLDTLENSPFWRPLTSELVTGNGVTAVPASEFEFGIPIQLRFIKVVCGQPWFHPKESGTIYRAPYSIIAIAGLRIYATTDIVQVAELGRTPPFDTEAMRNLAKRLRRRTVILDENPYLDSADAVQAFALQELRERYTDFEPIAVNAIAPTVEVWDTVVWTNPETSETRAYLVVGMNIGQSETTYLQLVDYTYFQEA